MANGYLLPRVDFTRNALIDLRGLNAGIDNWQARSQLNVENARQNKLMQMREQQMAQAAARAQAAAGRADERFAWDKEKYATDLEMRRQELAQRGQLQGLQRDKLQMELDAAKRQTPEARYTQAKQLGFDDDTARRYAAGMKLPTPTQQMIQGILRQSLPQQPGQAPRAGMQPMSAPSGLQGDPNFIRTQTASPPPPGQDVVSGSNFERLPLAEKRKLAEALMLSGEPGAKELGKQLIDDISNQSLGKTAMGEIDKKITASVDQLARLQGVSEKFNTEFQTIGGRAQQWANGIIAKLDPGSLDPKQARKLADFATFRRRSFENLNKTIQELSGAATSVQEGERIQMQLPNPGKTIWDGDDPITFASKLKDVITQTRLALARHSYLKRNSPRLLEQFARNKMEGIEQYMPLQKMRDVMNQRKDEIYQALRQQYPNASPQQLAPGVRQQLATEFGI